MPPSTAPTVVQPIKVGDGSGAEKAEADDVREARWAAVLERPLAEAGLQHLVVEDAGEAPAPPERQAESELQREQRQERPPTRQDGDESDHADDRLVHARGARVDHLRVVIRVGQWGVRLRTEVVCRRDADLAAYNPRRPVARYAPAALVAALLVATGLAFLHTESLKLETSPIRQTRVTKLFSPVCRCNTSKARIALRLAKPDVVSVSIVDMSGSDVRRLVTGKPGGGRVAFLWNGRDDEGVVVLTAPTARGCASI